MANLRSSRIARERLIPTAHNSKQDYTNDRSIRNLFQINVLLAITIHHYNSNLTLLLIQRTKRNRFNQFIKQKFFKVERPIYDDQNSILYTKFFFAICYFFR